MTDHAPARKIGTVLFEDGWNLEVYQGGRQPPVPLKEALDLVERHYRHFYGNISTYLKAEEDLMEDSKKLHFVLYSPNGELQGHQYLYGDGPSLMPTETLHPEIDIRRDSSYIFEVKRAVLLTRGKYHLFLRGISSYFLNQYGDPKAIPTDHRITGYSVEVSVTQYLIQLGFRMHFSRPDENWIYFPTREMLEHHPPGIFNPSYSSSLDFSGRTLRA